MREIKIDFDNPGLPQRLDVVENDAQSRFFKAVLYKDGKAYAAPSGATYSIMYRGFGPQNEGWYDTINDGAGKRAACSVSGNVVTCEIARQALRVPGHVSVVLCVTGRNGYMLHGWPIDCNCRNDNYIGGTSVESFFYITQVTNADWTSAIQTWEEIKNMIDPTLSLSGKAADAKATGDAVGEIKEDLDDLEDVPKHTVMDEYLNIETGMPYSFTGWDRSDYLPISGTHDFIIYIEKPSHYCGFFDADRKYIANIPLEDGYNYFVTPSNAKYIMLSAEHSNYGTIQLSRKIFRKIEESLYGFEILKKVYIRQGQAITNEFEFYPRVGANIRVSIIDNDNVLDGNVSVVFGNEEVIFDSDTAISKVCKESFTRLSFYTGAKSSVGTGYITVIYFIEKTINCECKIVSLTNPYLYDDGQTNVTIKFDELLYSHGDSLNKYTNIANDLEPWEYDYGFAKDVYKTNITDSSILVLDCITGHMKLIYDFADMKDEYIVMLARNTEGYLYGAYIDKYREYVDKTKGINVVWHTLTFDMIKSINTKVNSMLSEVSPDKFCFLWLSDNHDNGLMDRRVRYTALAAKKVLTDLEVDTVLNTGDVVLSDGGHCADALKRYFELIPQESQLFCQGNHDRSTELPMMTQTEFFNLAYRKNYLNDSFHFGKYPATYFYKDFKKNKIRVVVLDMYDSAVTTIDRTDNAGYKNDQLTWLCDVALTIDDGWSVIIATHSSPLSTEMSYNTGPNWNCTHLVEILEAFKNGTSIQIRGGTGEYALDLSHSFVSQGPRTIIGVFSGHNHVDAKIEKNGITYISEICGYIDIMLYLGDKSLTENLGLREAHKYSAIAFDVVVIDTKKRHVTLRRIGFGNDRDFTY